MSKQVLVLVKEIDAIRITMYEFSKKVDNLSDPLLVQLSQLLDEKLNTYNEVCSAA
ncbi:Spo0E family sporulation regulatory protein-aspartic acid phosphatase [Fictibacillus iocasae]|uniref:Spo0E family sporulation regulatory protein-aspartic acid phosphatase n=1 Tax=Fictibacillus iocasae TaxID=2715437 RepID=A0ABW2NM04_9BACL